jgi:hypothetical protein
VEGADPTPPVEELLRRGLLLGMCRDALQLDVDEDRERRRGSLDKPRPSLEEEGETRAVERQASVKNCVGCCIVRQRQESLQEL